MLTKNVYEIKPVLEFGKKYGIEIYPNKMCMKDLDRDRILCSQIEYNDKLMITLYMTEALINEVTNKLNNIHIEIKSYYKELDDLIEQVSKTKIYKNDIVAISDMETIIRNIRHINKIIDALIIQQNKLKYERDELMQAKNIILSLLEKREILIENEIFLL